MTIPTMHKPMMIRRIKRSEPPQNMSAMTTDTKRNATSWRLMNTMSFTKVGNEMNSNTLAMANRRPRIRRDNS
jgi:hypothetical protein